jgi:hypothetical protein
MIRIHWDHCRVDATPLVVWAPPVDTAPLVEPDLAHAIAG